MLSDQLIFVSFAFKDVVRHFCGKKKFIFFRRLRIVPDSKVQVDVPVDVKIFWNGKTLAGRKNVFYPRQCKNPKIRRAVVKTKNIPVSFLADNVIAVKNLFLKNLAPGTFVSERNNTAALYRLENLIEFSHAADVLVKTNQIVGFCVRSCCHQANNVLIFLIINTIHLNTSDL